MTITAEILSNQYSGNGSSTEFDFGFRVTSSTEVVVCLIDDDTGEAELLTLSDYSVSFNDDGTGAVTLDVAPAVGFTLDLRPVYAFKQLTNIKNQGRFLPEVHEAAFDRFVAYAQQLKRRSEAAIAAPDYENPQSFLLPRWSERANKTLAFDALGRPILVTQAEVTLPVSDFDVHAYGAVGDGIADDTGALRAAYQTAAAASIVSQRPVRLLLRPGKCYRITSRIIVEGAIAGLVTIGHGARLRVDPLVGDAIPALHFGYSVAPSLTAGTVSFDETLGRVANTTATADISKSSLTVNVVSTTGMAIGQAVMITSSGEYFFGITGDSGNNPRNKSEMNRIRKVVSATQITLDAFPEDSYSVSGYTVTVAAYSEISNIHFVGLEVIGDGDGSAHSADGSGIEAIRVEWCRNVSFTNGVMRNFSRCPWRDFQCTGVSISNNYLLGRDPSDSSNLPTISIWFYGPGHHGSIHVVFANNVCINLRRPQDLGPIGATSVARHILQAHNNVTGGQNGLGAHMCEHVTAIGNMISNCVSGYFYRARNITIIGGRVKATGTNTSDAIVVLGSVPVGAYAESPSLGRVRISGVTAEGPQNFVKAQNSFDALEVENCSLIGHAGYFLWTVVKAVRKLAMKGCHSDSTARVSSSRYGVYIQDDATNPMTVLDGVDIQGNTIMNGAEGIRIDGADADTAPAKHIRVQGNTFPACSVAGLTSDIRLGEAGFYDGVSVVLGPNNHFSAPSNVAVRLSSNSAVGMHRYTQMPVIETQRNVIGSAVNSSFGTPSWTNSTAKTTVRTGMRVRNSTPAAAAYSDWIVTGNGTLGTITASTTGSITSGTAALVVNDNTDNRVFVGAHITVAGAGVASANLSARVSAVNGAAITLDTNASTTVAGAAVSYTAPAIKGVGLIEA